MNKIILIFILVTSFTYGQNQKINTDNPGTTKTDDYLEEDWRELSKHGQHVEAASELIFLSMSDSTRNKHADYWHIGQVYAFDNQYKKAVFYIRESMKGKSENDDEQFWWYYKGILAFLQKNKNELKKYYDLLEKNHTNYYSNNAKVLKRLFENFEEPYSQAFPK